MYLSCQTASRQLRIFTEHSASVDKVLVQDANGKAWNLPILNHENGANGVEILADASSLQFWSPDSPVLYTLKVNDEACRFGFSSLRTVGNRDVLLNDEPIFMRGCIRGITAHDHPNMTGGSLKDAAEKYIRQAKKYGFNLVRFHSTVPNPEFVEAADELGFLIHAEIGFAYEYDEKGVKQGLDMNSTVWADTIRRYRNHPSMAIFCIGNEMHNSGHQPGVRTLFDEGKRLAPDKLILDNSGWGEYDRDTADIFSQHIAYFFPYKHHAKMFESDDCWHFNGSAFDGVMQEKHDGKLVAVQMRRHATPRRPVLAHEAMHYIELIDYDALNKKFDEFAKRVGPEYLEKNGIAKPRFLKELPELIKRKNLAKKMPEMIHASEEFKKMAIKTYIEQLRFSNLCGFEMLQFADCLKYENRNGIVDCFDDDKYIDPAWMKEFNADSALLLKMEKENYGFDETIKTSLYLSNFTPGVHNHGTLTVSIAIHGKRETVYVGKDFIPVPGLQKMADLELAFPVGDKAECCTLIAEYQSNEMQLTNHWNFWLYPKHRLAQQPTLRLVANPGIKALIGQAAESAQVCSQTVLTDTLDDQVFANLADGKNVLLLYDRNASRNQYFFPSTLERFKPCIWDRGSNLGGVWANPALAQAMASGNFDRNAQPLLEAGCKLNLDNFPGATDELVYGVDKPVRDRMKGLCENIKHFIDGDTLRNFCHVAAWRVGPGKLVISTMNTQNCQDRGAAAFFTALIDLVPKLEVASELAPETLKNYLTESTKRGPQQEDVMNHFWEIDNKMVEDTLFWESCGVDLRKLN